MDYETVIDIKSKPTRDPAMRDCINCNERTVHIEGRCATCGGN